MFGRRRTGRDFRAEIEAHLQLETDRLRGEGLSAEEARYTALRGLGNRTRAEEHFHESSPWSFFDTLRQDLRFGLRMFVQHPGSTLVALLTLALAIGVNTAIFSVLNAVLLKLLPVSHPEQLVMLSDPKASMIMDGLLQGRRSLLSYPEFSELSNDVKSLSGMCAASMRLERWPVRVAGGARDEISGRLVSANYFYVFGVEPAAGRLFAAHDSDGKNFYAVISYDYWQRRFAGSRSVLGTTIRFFDATAVVIGVSGPNFHGDTVGQNPDVWLPLQMQPLVNPGIDGLHERALMWLHVFGRLRPHVSRAQAQAEVTARFRSLLEAEYPAAMQREERRQALNQQIVLTPMRSGAFSGYDEFRRQWTILSALAGLILLLACANIANLLLARAATRSREVAIRLSIGATQARIVRQLLTESLLLASVGGAAGILLAIGVSHILVVLLAGVDHSFDVAPAIDPTVLAFTASAALLTGLLFGLAPALRATRPDVHASLKTTGRGLTKSRQRATFAKALVITQVALSLLLITGAGLFVRTLWNLQAVPLGYPKENLLIADVDSASAGYSGAHEETLFRELTGRIRAIPGVRGVTYSGNGFFQGHKPIMAIFVEGFQIRHADYSNTGVYGYTRALDDRGAESEVIGPDYFSTVGIPILRGREIGRQDTANAPPVCVINEAFAKHFFAGRAALGEHVTGVFGDISGHTTRRAMQVVGVVKDSREHSLRGPIDWKLYFPVDQHGGWGGGTFAIRVAGNPMRISHAVRSAIAAVDGNLPVKIQTLEQVVAAQNAPPRLIAQLCSSFGILALVLAAAGIYGVLSYGVARRTNEIGIRMALGAQRPRVVAMILGETTLMILSGVCVGAFASAAGGRLIATQLYGLSTMDPLTVGAAIAILGAVALLATLVPALRASRVDTLSALRHE